MSVPLTPGLYRYGFILNETRTYLLKGKVEEDFTVVTLTVDWIEFLDRYKVDKLFPKKRLLGTPPLLPADISA